MINRQAAEKKGRRAESLALWLLRLKGYKIIKARYKTPVGEIDIIAKKAGTLVFIEVKARKKQEAALHALGPKQQRRIERAARLYLRRSGHTGPVRFDLMVKSEDHFFVKHLKAAWRPSQ